MIHATDAAWDAICALCLQRARATGASCQEDAEVIALWRLQADGYNGGFIQFFCNWGEENCAVAMQALQRIGAEATLDIVRRQRSLLERFYGHPEVQGYWDIPRLMTEAELQLMEEQLDPAFWRAAEEIPALALPVYQYIADDSDAV